MSIQVQLRGGNTSAHSVFTGAEREATVDTDKDTLVVHDGTTPGGHPLAKEVDLAALSESVSALIDRVSVNSAAGGAASVTSTELSAVSAQAASAIAVVRDGVSIVSNTLSVETAARIAKDDVLSNAISVLSQLLSVVSNAASAADAHASVASAAATSADGHANTVSIAAAAADAHAGTASAAATSADAHANTASAAATSAVALANAADSHANTASAAATSADAHANTASAAATSADTHAATASAAATSVLTFVQGVSARSLLTSVKGLQSVVDTLSNRISAVSSLIGVGGASVTSNELSAVSAQAKSAIDVVSNQLSVVSSQVSTVFAYVVATDATIDAHAAAASAAATSVDLRVSNLKSAVSAASALSSDGFTTKTGLQEVYDSFAGRIDAASVLGNAVFQSLATLSARTTAAVSVKGLQSVVNHLSAKISVADAHASVASVAVTSVDARVNSVVSTLISAADLHASVASAAATSVDGRVTSIVNGIGGPQIKVVGDVQGVSATAGIKISGLSASVAIAVYKLEAMLLFSTSGTANTFKFGMSASTAVAKIAGAWEVMISAANNQFVSAGTVRGNFNTIASAQVSCTPGTAGAVRFARMDAIADITTGGTIRLRAAVSATSQPVNIMKGSYLQAFKIT